jgi:hypothetical protein
MISSKYTKKFIVTLVIPQLLFLNYDLGRMGFLIRRNEKKLDKEGTDNYL